MSETAKMWIEVSFDVLYLIVIWFLVYRMYCNKGTVRSSNKLVAKYFLWAFALLALGDTGHVGFRVLAYIRGGLAQNAALTGIGKLTTAVTVTIFYVLVLMIWKARYKKPYGIVGLSLFLAAIIRLLLLIPAANQWTSAAPPLNWVYYRNLPLMYQGLGVALLILSDAIRNKDRMFRWISYMIFTSYAFYTGTMLFVHRFPLMGMLMIPKTVAYLVIAFIGYYGLYRERTAS